MHNFRFIKICFWDCLPERARNECVSTLMFSSVTGSVYRVEFERVQEIRPSLENPEMSDEFVTFRQTINSLSIKGTTSQLKSHYFFENISKLRYDYRNVAWDYSFFMSGTTSRKGASHS
jgi:hypothetical protein